MTRTNAARVTAALLASSLLSATACSMLQQVAALRQVEFTIDSVSSARLAGISIDSVRSYRDLTSTQIAAIGLALARRELPFEFNLHLNALNPSDNGVTARLVQMDWAALLEEREVVSGVISREYQFVPGVPQDVPVEIRVDLADVFEKNAQDMLELALAVAGAGGAPKRISLRAQPTIQTVVGPIRYPQPITIVSRTVGGVRN
jgi:hypothetical protein